MSAKKIKKYGDINVPAQSLHPPDKDGFLTKQGGSIKTWKKRYFILKDSTLYYYKTNKDAVFTGKIELESGSTVKEESSKKKPNMFAVTTLKRIFFMVTEKPEELQPWINAIKLGIERAQAKGVKPRQSQPDTPDTEVKKPTNTNSSSSFQETKEPAKTPQKDLPVAGEMPPRVRLGLAKQVINFLKGDSKVLEFWQIWSESIPLREELTPGASIDFHVAASADLTKLTWRTSGPQSVFIQRMVDFFWNVGAPETEIDRLNDVGALINPNRIGSWIDMSSKGGMDGGWYFPGDIPLKLAIEAADPCDALTRFNDWCQSQTITTLCAVGRDMGAAPPRQTELKIKLPGADAAEQIRRGLSAFEAFNFPPVPATPLEILNKSHPESGCYLSVITSSEGFVRLGLLIPKPSDDTVMALCQAAEGDSDEMANLEGALGAFGPSFVEFQYLQKGFGYGVYKEGFDIVFHFNLGEEMP
eukprot:TRINITY_DN19424_c0_g1_i1.p1 TRINITY_DN19424_c0_g1~~TRINITY_DN19424_c0_g1_i1.p1  ORF type:complete len:472 (-),score=156.82 TRINITY_DN19424_c0_g1_i1:100-1515(-)